MPDDKVELFDEWASIYDDVFGTEGDAFPFAGYDRVLAAVADLAVAGDPERVLDLGIGTGNLAAAIRARSPDVEIWGVDFSPRMLDIAGRKVPDLQIVRADLVHEFPALDLPRFDAVVSTYVLHEFPDAAKLDLIGRLANTRLAPGGLVAIGDIAFETAAGREAVRRDVGAGWDETEHYLTADRFLPRLRARGLDAEYRQVSRCAGVIEIRRR